MAVVGIDFGSYSCFIAVARAGGIETIANEYSDRSTPTYVTFNEKKREMGAAAKQQAATNVKNTLTGFKNLIGRKFKDPVVHQDAKWFPYKVTEGPNGTTGIHVRYMSEDQVFNPEQVTAMMLTKLKHIAEAVLHTKVKDVVISVPCSFTDIQRRSMLEATQMAGLNCLRLMSDTLAVSLAYGIYKQDLPAENEKSRNVVFVDMGYTCLQVSLCAFNKGKLKMLAIATDNNLGGRNFDRRLIEHFAEEVKKKQKLDVLSNPKAVVRMNNEVEKLKKLMSTNTQKIPLNIECLMNDKDVHSSMDRATFDELTSPYLQRVKQVLDSLLRDIKFPRNDVHSIEIVGGSSRVPSVKAVVKEVFGQEPSTTLNADEAVARGCALQCAILSPTFRVRDFSITDCQLYPVTLRWKGGMDEDSDLEICPKYHAVPFFKMLTFFRKEPLTIDCKYTYPNDIPYANPNIGSFHINNIQPQANGESSKVKVKVCINIHGIFSVASAALVEKLPDAETKGETMDVDYTKANGEVKGSTVEIGNSNTDLSEDQAAEAASKENSEASEAMQTDDNSAKVPPQSKAENADKPTEENPSPKKKKTTKMVDLPIDVKVQELARAQLNNFIEKEAQMIMQDKQEKDRQFAKNEVEEYIYEMRDKLYNTYEEFILEKDREQFSVVLRNTENWLYEDGEDVKKDEYTKRMQSLKAMGDPVVKRYHEARDRPAAIDSFGTAIQRVCKFMELAQAKDEKYTHITDEELAKVDQSLRQKTKWFDKQMHALSAMAPHQDPPVLVSQFASEIALLESVCNPIMNKPVPKVEPPKEEAAKPDANPAPADGDQTNNAAAEEAGTPQKPTIPQKPNTRQKTANTQNPESGSETMEVD